MAVAFEGNGILQARGGILISLHESVIESFAADEISPQIEKFYVNDAVDSRITRENTFLDVCRR